MKFGDALKSLTNGKILNVVCARSFHEGVFDQAVIYSCETHAYSPGEVKDDSSRN